MYEQLLRIINWKKKKKKNTSIITSHIYLFNVFKFDRMEVLMAHAQLFSSTKKVILVMLFPLHVSYQNVHAVSSDVADDGSVKHQPLIIKREIKC